MAGEPGRSGVDGQHGRAGADPAAGCLGRPVTSESPYGGALVEANAALGEPPPQPEREPRGLDVRRHRQQCTAAPEQR